MRVAPTGLLWGATSTSLLLLASTFLHPTALQAQTVRGTLVDGTTRRPIAAGVVSLLTEGGVTVAQAETDSLGAFRLSGPGPASYYLRGERTGYATKTDGILDFERRDGHITVDFYLQPAPVELPGLHVQVRGGEVISDPVVRRRLRVSGFVDRQRLGIGSFRTPSDMARLSTMSPRDVFRGIPRLRVLPSSGVGGEAVRLQCTTRPRGTVPSQFGGFVNGVEVFRGSQWEIAADVPLMDIVALEAYTGVAQMPLEYSKLGLCGVILVWTR